MKFLVFAMNDVAKMADVAQAWDKIQANPPAGTKTLATYICQGIPFAGTVPPNATVGISVVEAESNEAIATNTYPMALAGATVWYVPVLEIPAGRGAQTEKQFRG